MTEEVAYHYTTEEAAKAIVLAGEISPSLQANGDAAHGDGVYLTTLEPRLGRSVIVNNNWDGLAASNDKKLEVYFEIMMPSSKVARIKERRDIQVYPGALWLDNFKWSLKNFGGELMATQHFMVSSQGEAARLHSRNMGRDTLVRDYVTEGRRFVYKKDEGGSFLYLVQGHWVVSPVAGDCMTALIQYSSTPHPSPPKTFVWSYAYNKADVEGSVINTDITLKVYPCY